MAEELGVETTETPKSDNHTSELLLGAADVGPVGVGELVAPQILIVLFLIYLFDI
jgi:hypothetical protein